MVNLRLFIIIFTGKDINSPTAPRLSTPSFRFGIIGAGSANSIVSTVHETDDWATAAVHIAIGKLFSG